MVDVVQRPVGVPITLREQVRCHPTDDELAGPLVGTDTSPELRRHGGQVDALRDHGPGLVDPEALVTPGSAFRGDDVRRQRWSLHQLDGALRVIGIVGVEHGRPWPRGQLLVVQGEQGAIPRSCPPEADVVEGSVAGTKEPVPDSARYAPIGQAEQARIQALQPGQQLRIARVVVPVEPDREECDPVGASPAGRRRAFEMRSPSVRPSPEVTGRRRSLVTRCSSSASRWASRMFWSVERRENRRVVQQHDDDEERRDGEQDRRWIGRDAEPAGEVVRPPRHAERTSSTTPVASQSSAYRSFRRRPRIELEDDEDEQQRRDRRGDRDPDRGHGVAPPRRERRIAAPWRQAAPASP